MDGGRDNRAFIQTEFLKNQIRVLHIWAQALKGGHIQS